MPNDSLKITPSAIFKTLLAMNLLSKGSILDLRPRIRGRMVYKVPGSVTFYKFVGVRRKRIIEIFTGAVIRQGWQKGREGLPRLPHHLGLWRSCTSTT